MLRIRLLIAVLASAASICRIYSEQTPAVDADGTVYRVFGNVISAQNAAGRLWQIPTYPVAGELLLLSNLVIFASINHQPPATIREPNFYYIYLHALDNKTGVPRWTFQTVSNGLPTAALRGPAVNLKAQVLFSGFGFASDSGAIVPNPEPFVDTANGISPVGAPPFIKRAIGADGTHYEAEPDSIRARDPRNGRTLWTSLFYSSPNEPVIADDGSVMVTLKSGGFHVLDQATGKRLWSYPSGFFAAAFESNRVALIAGESLVVFDVATGDILSTHEIKVPGAWDSSKETSFAVSRGSIFINTYPATWILGDFRYADSTWPRRNARDDNIPSLARQGPPRILTGPQHVAFDEPMPQFSAYVQGSLPLSYQWFKNGAEITGATNVSYSPPAASFSNAFQVRITNDEGAVLSRAAQIGFRVEASGDGARIRRDPHWAAYPYGTEVKLTAESRSGRPFLGWTGTIQRQENPLVIRVETNLFLTAQFAHERFDFLWAEAVGQHEVARPVVGTHGLVYMHAGGALVAVDLLNRRTVWRQSTAGRFVRQLIALDTGDLASLSESEVSLIDGQTGLLKWSKTLAAHAFAADPWGNLYLSGRRLRRLSAEGVEQWSTADTSSLISQPILLPDGAVLVTEGGIGPGRVHALDRNTGRTLWRVPGDRAFPGPFNRLIIFDEANVYHPLFKTLNLLDPKDGRVTATLPLRSFSAELPADLRVTREGRIFLLPSFSGSRDVLNVQEWDLENNLLRALGTAPFADALVTEAGSLVSLNNRKLYLWRPPERWFEPPGITASDTWKEPVDIAALLPEGSIAVRAGKDALSFHLNGEPLALSVRPSSSLNAQGSFSLLKAGSPSIYTQPADQLFVPGATGAFAVDATGAPPLSFQWFRGNDAIAGATGSELVLTNLSTAELRAEFSAEIRNSEGAIRTRAASFGYRIEVITRGRGKVELSAGSSVVRPGTLVTARAFSEDRGFARWRGTIESTNPVLTFRAESNTVLEANFDALPGDLLAALPVLRDAALWPDSLSIQTSERTKELLLPNFVRLDLGRNSMSTLLPDVALEGASARVGETVFGQTIVSRTNRLARFKFGADTAQHDVILPNTAEMAVDSETNLYVIGSDGLVKLRPSGMILWSNRIAGFYSAGARIRIGLDGKGILWRETAVAAESDYVIFSTAAGTIEKRLKLARNGVIPVLGKRVIAKVPGSEELIAAEIDSASTFWTNRGPATLMVTDDRSVYAAGGSFVRAIDLATGEMLWRAAFPDFHAVRSITLGSDARLYARSDRLLRCFDTADGSMVWQATPPLGDAFPELPNQYEGSLSLSAEGALYCFSTGGVLLAYKTSAGLSHSSWPEPNGRGSSRAAMPKIPPDRPRLEWRHDGQAWHLGFLSRPEAVYRLETAQTIASGAWQVQNTIQGDGLFKSVFFPFTAGAAFYRLRLEH